MTRAQVRRVAPRLDFDAYPALDRAQAGHLRHIYNLAQRPGGDWSLMGSADPGQETLSAYRYQLAYMAYTLGLAHHHWLPAAPGPLAAIFRELIAKMLRRDVWGYWRDMSQSSPRLDPALRRLLPPVTDPVGRENIMYSGHLHAMIGMYSALFGDDRYTRPGALTFHYSPLYYGLGPETFAYDAHKLNETIYWQMVENGWLGVACEPNCIFLVCNQFPMLGFRFHDVTHGTAYAEEAATAYHDAWSRKGLLGPDGHLTLFLRQRQDTLISGNPGMDAWTLSVMNAWNREFVDSVGVAPVMRGLERLGDGALAARLWRGVRSLGAPGETPPRLELEEMRPDLGFYAAFLSERGHTEALAHLLRYADTRLGPTWERGGLYYPRNDAAVSEDGEPSFVEPLTGNVLLGYARINVPHGLRALYERPSLSAGANEPHIASMSATVDILRAWWDSARDLLAISVQPSEGATQLRVDLAGFHRERPWTLLWDGVVVAESGAYDGHAELRVEETASGLCISAPLARRADLAVLFGS
ncbi:hypothetical protein [Phenylobacterium sp.]|uniref:linalool dehydratase/isomerase domain-containing protein n=1 Tax=Phenylobacterium sp. TaxID=1871053 RepID=UPI0035AEE8DC